MAKIRYGTSVAIIHGVAHVGTDAERVRRVILQERPVEVLIEADLARFGAHQAARAGAIADFPEPGPFPGLLPVLYALLLGAASTSVESLWDNRYGEEQSASAAAAAAVGARLRLADRDLKLTLCRASHELSWVDLLRTLPEMSGVTVPPGYRAPLPLLARFAGSLAAGRWGSAADALADITTHATTTAITGSSGRKKGGSDDAALAAVTVALMDAAAPYNACRIAAIRDGASMSVQDKARMRRGLEAVLATLQQHTQLTARDMPAALAAERDLCLAFAVKQALRRVAAESAESAEADEGRGRTGDAAANTAAPAPTAAAATVVAVVGHGHVAGICAHLARWQAAEASDAAAVQVQVQVQVQREWAEVAPLLQPPPLHAARTLAAPAATVATLIWLRRSAYVTHAGVRRAAGLVLGAGAVTAAAGLGFVSRILELNSRVRTAVRGTGTGTAT